MGYSPRGRGRRASGPERDADGAHCQSIRLVDNAPRSATVQVETDTTLIKIKRRDFKNLIAGNKEIERKFYKSFSEVLCKRLRVTNENLTFSQEINRMIEEIDNK